MKKNEILTEIQRIDEQINTPVSFLAQTPKYSIDELNAIRFFALNLLQAKMNRIVKKEDKNMVYKNSFNTHLSNTPY
jgi:hypothetical protein